MESTLIEQPGWRPVVGFEGVYEVSSCGQVRRVGAAANRKLFRRGCGYDAIYLTDGPRRVCKLVHALVLESFVGPRPYGNVARHLNGIRADNRLQNLAWGTPQENSDDMRRHGTSPAGERNGRAKLTDGAVVEIRASRLPFGVLAEKFSVSLRTVIEVRAGLRWRHV